MRDLQIKIHGHVDYSVKRIEWLVLRLFIRCKIMNIKTRAFMHFQCPSLRDNNYERETRDKIRYLHKKCSIGICCLICLPISYFYLMVDTLNALKLVFFFFFITLYRINSRRARSSFSSQTDWMFAVSILSYVRSTNS